MKLRTTFPAALMLGLGLFLLDPSPAAAAEVMCSTDYGHCTVSNTNGSFISCSCGDNGGDEGTGGDDFEGMSEEELLEVCEDAVAFCEDNGEGGEAESGTTGADPTAGQEEGGVDGEEGDTDDEPGTTGVTSGGGEEGFPGEEEEAGTDGAESDGGDSGDSGGDSGGEGNSTGDEGDPESTGDSGGDSGGEGNSTGDEGNSTGDESPGGEEEGQQESGDGETGSPADEVEGGGGCSVATNSGLGLLGLALLGLFGLHRRERQQVV